MTGTTISGCSLCGYPPGDHGTTYALLRNGERVGFHEYQAPSDEQRAERKKRRMALAGPESPSTPLVAPDPHSGTGEGSGGAG